ncbi:protein kinase domain-containing protein [Nonomuraea insulae]|uniref:Protein kinase n=1 Tax=Nonomuraea insulae TaxID=1616787 RepID=A0ABW1CVE4_9ACTN
MIDFGIARALDTDGDRTATGRWVGTPDYMAPELTDGGTWSTASDVFAWGCVVFAAAMGHGPVRLIRRRATRAGRGRPDAGSGVPAC